MRPQWLFVESAQITLTSMIQRQDTWTHMRLGFSESSDPPVLVGQGWHNKVPRTTEINFSQFWRVEV